MRKISRAHAILLLVAVASFVGGSVATATILGAMSASRTVTVLQVSLASTMPASVSPVNTYYFSVTATSSYHDDQAGVWLQVIANVACSSLPGFTLFEYSFMKTAWGYVALQGVTSGSTCVFQNLADTRTVPAGSSTTLWYFREDVTQTLPTVSWSFQAAQ